MSHAISAMLRAPRASIWAASIVYLVSLLGTLLLANEPARPWAVLLLVVSAVLAVLFWGHQEWIPALLNDVDTTTANRSGFLSRVALTISVLFALAADFRYVAAPIETFGVAGILWLAAVSMLVLFAFLESHSLGRIPKAPRSERWTNWEIALVVGLFLVALLSRVWNLTKFPDNIYPDEIMTGTVANNTRS